MNTCQKPLKKNPRNFVKQQQINQLTKSVKKKTMRIKLQKKYMSEKQAVKKKNLMMFTFLYDDSGEGKKSSTKIYIHVVLPASVLFLQL